MKKNVLAFLLAIAISVGVSAQTISVTDSAIGQTSVVFKVRVQNLTQKTFYEVVWGVSPNYNLYNSIPTLINPTVDTTIFVPVNGLTPNTNYSRRAQLEGAVVAFSPVGNFTTGSCNFFVTINGSSSICIGESINLTVSGGAINYMWSTGSAGTTITVSPTSTTTYTVSGTDGNCTITDKVTITVNPLPVVEAGNNQTICSGSSVNLLATGNGVTNWLWDALPGLSSTTIANPTAKPTATTTYTVVGMNSGGCIGMDSVTVTVNNVISSGTSNDTTICKGNSVNLSATGGGTYKWNTGATTAIITVSPTITTTYMVTIADGVCSATGDVKVTVNTVPTATIVTNPSNGVGCGSVSLTASSSNSLNYLWSNGQGTQTIMVTISGTYTVTVSNGCKNVQSVAVKVLDKPVLNSYYYNSNNGSLILNGVFPGGISLIKINGNPKSPSNGDESQAVFSGIVLHDADLVIIETISNDCYTTWVYDQFLAVEEEGKDMIIIKQNEQIILFDLTGRIIKKINSPKDFAKSEIYLVENLFNDVSSGFYFWSSPKVKSKKFIK